MRSVQFYMERTCAEFGSFVFDEYWSEKVLELAHTNACIRHGLSALSTYHERYWRSAEGKESAYGLHQYNLAIRDLVTEKFQNPSTLHIQLVSCTMFICIEVSACVPVFSVCFDHGAFGTQSMLSSHI